MSEVWKDIAGYEGYYQISNYGRVRSLDRQHKSVGNNMQNCPGKMLKLNKTEKGYLTVNLSKDSKLKVSRVHRLVANAFIINPNNKPNIDHIDGNPSNNEVSNLQWCTQKENMNNPIHSERRAIANKNRDYSKINKRGKYVVQIDASTEIEIAQFISAKDASRKTKSDQTGIINCCKGKQLTAGGYKWKYVTI